MQDEDQNFARCAGNPALGYCPQCKRNIKNFPFPPGPNKTWWLGPWVVEAVPCPNFKEMKDD